MQVNVDQKLGPAGHRKRLRERFAKSGRGTLADYELLELLLTYAIPRIDTKPIAKNLLQLFGTILGVLQQPDHRLLQVNGIGRQTVFFIMASRCDVSCMNKLSDILDEQDHRLFGRRLPNRIEPVMHSLSAFRNDIAGIAVESTYNWYWLVDGLKDAGFKMHLANPSAIKQYKGLKHTDDKWDSFVLVHVLRLGILPQGYIYPKDKRPVRDLMRKRHAFVQKRTSHILSLQSMASRHLAVRLPVNEIKKMTDKHVDILFKDQYTALSAKNHIESIHFLTTKNQKYGENNSENLRTGR